MRTTATTRVRPALLGLLLLLAGCRPDGPTVPRYAAIDAAVLPRFRTQATTADINHVTFKLYTWSGASLGTLMATHQMTWATGQKAHFDPVPIGTYKVTAEAFSSPDDSVSITSGSAQVSTNSATIDGSGITYSAGTYLTVPIQLRGGSLAPADAGNVDLIHLYQVTKRMSVAPFAPVVSDFVWIPRFTAWQLITPTNCGGTLRNGLTDYHRPAGFWVKTPPSMGVEGTDWVKEVFGGFYVGKYEASHDDATAAFGGVGTLLKVQPNMPPWINIDWEAAQRTCANYDGNGYLIGDKEWTALSVWSMINFVDVHGNDQALTCSKDINTTFTIDTTGAGQRALTGTGTNPGWPLSTNLTSHTGDRDGAYDLSGNVQEWTATLGLSASSDWVVQNADTRIAWTAGTNAYFRSLATQIPLRLLGVPATTGTNDSANFNQAFVGSGIGTKSRRGGEYGLPGRSSIWSIMLDQPKTYAGVETGFRPILRY